MTQPPNVREDSPISGTEIDNLRNRLQASKKSPNYNQRTHVDVPSDLLTRIIDILDGMFRAHPSSGAVVTEEMAWSVAWDFIRRMAAVVDGDERVNIPEPLPHEKKRTTEAMRAAIQSALESAAMGDGEGLLSAIERNCWDLVPQNVPTGGDDYDVIWEVRGHWMAAPSVRVLGIGKSPAEAIKEALRRRNHNGETKCPHCAGAGWQGIDECGMCDARGFIFSEMAPWPDGLEKPRKLAPPSESAPTTSQEKTL